jgi:ElaB/YqjD/DUF883 family membrane-anchored ribosome-binding protein
VKNKGKKSHEFREFRNIDAPKKKAPVPIPDVFHMDLIGTMTDDELLERLRMLEADRERVLDARFDPAAWEIEAAYVRRELQLRRTRHNLHEEYLQQLDYEAREAQRMEDRYPVADLDNSAFMFWN